MSYERFQQYLARADRRRSAPPGCSRASGCSPRRSRPAWACSAGQPVLNLCANNYLGLADHPAVRQAAHEALDRWGYGMASVRFICGTQELHKQLEARPVAVPRHRGHDPLLLLLGRQRRPVRDAAGRRGRGHLRRAEPRLDHRRHPPLQGPAAPLPQQRHGRPGGQAAGGPRRPLPPDRHRRRVLDGRDHRQPAGDLRAGRPLRRAGDGRRFARRGVPRSAAAAARPSITACAGRIDILTGTLGKALGGGSGGYTSGRRGDHRAAAPAVAALPVLQLAAAADRGRLAQVAGAAEPARPSCATGWRPTPAGSAAR